MQLFNNKKNPHMTRFLTVLSLALTTLTLGFASPAFALPQDWGIDFQAPASTSAQRIFDFHHIMMYIITAITLFVLALLIWVVVRYNKWTSKTPQQFSHNVTIEILWTAIPILILVFIMIKSFPLLYYIDRSHEPEMTLKATGYQWYWGYEYPDQGGINFQSYMIPDKEIDKSKGQLRLLSTDNPVVLPVDTNIQILTTAADVIHAFAMPALGVKIDAIPGRINETWVRITKPGIYYGQCSELCGKDHAFMPIEIHAVSREEFNAWAISKGGTGLKVAEAAQSETAPETKPETTPAQKAE
jgi:cytochrome c oxidase subunit 2